MFKPYPHQVEFLQAMGSGKKRACNVWHRRAGKDLAAFLGWMVPEAYRKTGTYYYFFPTYAQGKKIIWDAIDSDGIKITHHIPYWQKCQFNETELQITLPPVAGGSNGSIIQLIGTDKLDSIVGTNPVGCIFSEYSLQNPQAWSYIRPILEANGGWAIFVFTPRGNNWGFKLYKEACTSKDWYVSVKTINQTSKHDGSPIITMDQIQNMRAEGEDEDIIQQEYFCLRPDTRILTADLRWVQIRDMLQQPTDLIGVDEHAAKNGKRKFRRARILHAQQTKKRCYRITFLDGSTVESSAEHPWLVRSTRTWVETKDLIPGIGIAESGLRPWGTDTSYSGGYLAGLFDGEGCVSRTSVSVAQKPGPVLDRIRTLLEEKGLIVYEMQPQKGCVTLGTNMHNAMALLGRLRPVRLLKKAESIWNGRYAFNGTGERVIAAIEEIGVQDVVGITTSTGTFIAEGLATHNCSFSGAQSGSYYSSYVVKAQETGRVRPNLYDPNLPVDTFWDIGNGDSTVIGFRQVAYNERRWVDCYAHSRQDLPEFARVLSELSRTRGFRYRHHYFPHDMKVTEFTTNESRIAAARRLGIRPCSIVAKRPLMEGIDAVRRAFPRYWFDADHCADLVNSLTFYHKKWNKEGRVFTDVPDHDEHSHFADMVRYEAIQGGVMTQDEYIVRPHSAITEFDPVSYRAEPTRTRGQWSMPIIGADPFGD